MMQILCKVDVLVVSDVTPRLRLVRGKVHTLAPALYHKSRKLQDALRRGDIAIVGAKGGSTPTPSPPVSTKPVRAARARKKAAPAPVAPDMAEVSKAVEDLKGLHNLFVHLAGEIQGRQAPEGDGSIKALLESLQHSVEGLAGRLDQIETRIAERPVTVVAHPGATTSAPVAAEHTPIYIPSEIRTEIEGDARIEVETKTEESDLGDAEAALKAMRGTSKP